MNVVEQIDAVGGYHAEMTDEGLVLYDVPIFCACSFDAGSDDESKVIQFDERWVAAAFRHAMKRKNEGYKPPMHIRHHDRTSEANDSVRKAGYFKVQRTGPITLDGRRRTAVYADLVFTDTDAQAEIRTNQLNYRSVEIFDYTASPTIDGLALLDHEAPHLALPMLQIEGQIQDMRTPAGVANANFQTPSPPAHRASMVCFRRAGTTAYPTFKDSIMKTPEQIAEEAEATEAARIANLGGHEVANLEADKDKDVNMTDDSDDDKDANMDAHDKDDDDADMAEGDAGIDWAAVAKALETGEGIDKVDYDLVLAAIQNQSSETAVEEETMMEEEVVDKDRVQAAVFKAGSRELVAMAKMQGELDAIKARDHLRDTSDKRVNDVAKALTRLKGMPLGADLQGKLVKFHKAHGGAAFGDYVESLAQNTVIDPGERADQTTAAFRTLGGRVPAIAMKYQNGGAEDVETASGYCREYKQLQESGARMKIDEKTYVENNMKRAQVIAVETV